MVKVDVRGLTVTLDDDFGAFAQLVGMEVLFGANRRPRLYLRMRQLCSVLLPSAPGFVVDHINGDTLDNRRDNLQAITGADNLRKRPTTECPGVRRVPGSERFVARTGNRQSRRFRSLEQARIAADGYRRLLSVKGMPLNFPEIGEYGWDGKERMA